MRCLTVDQTSGTSSLGFDGQGCKRRSSCLFARLCLPSSCSAEVQVYVRLRLETGTSFDFSFEFCLSIATARCLEFLMSTECPDFGVVSCLKTSFCDHSSLSCPRFSLSHHRLCCKGSSVCFNDFGCQRDCS